MAENIQKNKDSSDSFSDQKYLHSENFRRCDDIVLSSRSRLIRNLADFPFPHKMSAEDFQRIDSLVYDAFSSFMNVVQVKKADVGSHGMDILKMKSYIHDENFSSVIISPSNSDFSCEVNNRDHIRMAYTAPGLACEDVVQKIYSYDSALQKKLQFAANCDFGYLTSNIKDSGSALKLSFRIFIPSIVLSGKFGDVIALAQNQKFCIRPVFNPHDDVPASLSNCIFDLYTGYSFCGTEFEQMAAILSAVQNILNTERKIRVKFADNNPTVLLNFFKQNYAKAMYSLLLTYEDGVNAICAAKWALSCSMIKGVSDSHLNALFHRTQDDTLEQLMDDLVFEDDIKDSFPLKIQRLRALLIHQCFEEIENESPVT